MAEGASTTTVDNVLDAIFRNESYAIAAIWMQLHVGAPGSAGTSNVAGNTTRVNVSSLFGTDAATGSITNTADIDWTSVSTSETYSKCSFWTASTGGTFIASGSVTASAVTAGDDFTIEAGDCTVTMPTAS